MKRVDLIKTIEGPWLRADSARGEAPSEVTNEPYLWFGSLPGPSMSASASRRRRSAASQSDQ
jgi:hypothetical protein